MSFTIGPDAPPGLPDLSVEVGAIAMGIGVGLANALSTTPQGTAVAQGLMTDIANHQMVQSLLQEGKLALAAAMLSGFLAVPDDYDDETVPHTAHTVPDDYDDETEPAPPVASMFTIGPLGATPNAPGFGWTDTAGIPGHSPVGPDSGISPNTSPPDPSNPGGGGVGAGPGAGPGDGPGPGVGEAP